MLNENFSDVDTNKYQILLLIGVSLRYNSLAIIFLSSTNLATDTVKVSFRIETIPSKPKREMPCDAV